MGQLISLAVREGYLGKTMAEGRTGNYFCTECHPSGWSRARQPRSASWFGLILAALVESYENYSEKCEQYQFLVHEVAVGTVHIKGMKMRDFPGGPVAKTPHSQSRGSRFNPWSGN